MICACGHHQCEHGEDGKSACHIPGCRCRRYFCEDDLMINHWRERFEALEDMKE